MRTPLNSRTQEITDALTETGRNASRNPLPCCVCLIFTLSYNLIFTPNSH
jgi:hypothetical protein